jgi:hypothetical protein
MHGSGGHQGIMWEGATGKVGRVRAKVGFQLGERAVVCAAFHIHTCSDDRTEDLYTSSGADMTLPNYVERRIAREVSARGVPSDPRVVDLARHSARHGERGPVPST